MNDRPDWAQPRDVYGQRPFNQPSNLNNRDSSRDYRSCTPHERVIPIRNDYYHGNGSPSE